MLVNANISAPNRPKSAPRSSPHTPPPRFGALAHRLRRCAPMFKIARIGAHWRALAQNLCFKNDATTSCSGDIRHRYSA